MKAFQIGINALARLLNEYKCIIMDYYKNGYNSIPGTLYS